MDKETLTRFQKRIRLLENQIKRLKKEKVNYEGYLSNIGYEIKSKLNELDALKEMIEPHLVADKL